MERYNYKGKEIIGIDHGFGNIKCRHVAFRSGVRAYDSEPPMTADVLIFGGKYYVVGEEHKGFVSDKSQDEDYYILTVAALARELEFRHITECEAVLAVGLPIQWIGAQKESFRKYLMRNELIEFRYNEQDYLVRIDDVQIFPQGFAGVVQRLGDFKGLNVLADIGNGTMNTLMLKDGKPMLSRCYTDKLGVEQCIIRMSNELLAVSGHAMPYDVCEDFLRKGNAELPEKYTAVMQRAAEEYSDSIIAKLREYEFNPEIMRLTVMGGGACILKHFWSGNDNRIRYIEDICATAKGYELLALNNLKRRDEGCNMRKSEKTFLLRFDLSRKTDREIWEWLHEKSESQTLSMNAFLIEGLRKLMAQEANEKPLDAHALAEEICRELRAQRLFVPTEGESPESTIEAEDEIPADILDFANSF